jgi:mRNA interferase MazF
VSAPRRGEIWSVELDPTRGREQAGRRPALVISVDRFNQGPAGLVIVVPLTTVDKRQPLHVRLEPPQGGVREPSFAKSEDLRSVSVERLISRWGAVEPETVRAVAARIRLLTGG